MDEIRRIIMNEFSDEKSCDMFLLVLKQKWSEFKGGLTRRCNVEIVRDSNVARCMSTILTFEYLDNFLFFSEWAEEKIIYYRDTLSPKAQTFSGIIEAKFEFF